MKKTIVFFAKLVLVVAIVFLGATRAFASAPPVQSGTSGGTGGSTANTQTFSTAATNGNVMVFAIMDQTDSTTTVSSITFACGTPTLVASPVTGAASKLWMYTAQVTSAGCTQVVVNFSASINSIVIYSEYSGMATSSVLDCSSSATGTSTAINSGSCTTTNANDTLVTGIFVPANPGGTLTAGSGYTLEVNSSTARGLEDQNVSATGSYAGTATYSSSQIWLAFMVALKQAATAAATPSADVASGTYLSPLAVNLTGPTSGSTICYTTDGSTPTAVTPGTCTNGTAYTTTLSFSTTTTLKAIATKAAFTNSGVLTATYTVRSATSFYVSNAGSDSNTGADTSHTWAHAPGMTGCTSVCASTVLLPGDTINLNKGDSWTNTTLTVGYGGNSGARIRLTAYGSGAKPIISSPVNSPAITVTAANMGYWTIDGLDLKATGIVSGIGYALAIYHNYWPGGNEGSIPNWIVQNNTIEAPIFMFGPNSSVLNNTFNGTAAAPNNTRGAIILRGVVSTGGIITGNTVSNFIDRGIWITNGAGTATISNNTVHNITTGSDDEGVGIDLDGAGIPTSGNQTDHNTVYTCDFVGISHENTFTSSTYDNLIHDVLVGMSFINYTTNRSVANNSSANYNVIYNTNSAFKLWDTSHWTFENNTAYQGTGSTPTGFNLNSASTFVNNLTFTNNILAGTWTHPIFVPDSAAIWAQLDYNDITPAGSEVLFQTSGGSKTIANLQGGGLMTHGTTTDPLFVSTVTPDFHLQGGSPAINSGFNTGLTLDFVGVTVPQGGAYDMGAYEYTSTAKAITSFNFNALSPAVTGTVNEGAKTVSLTVPFGTSLTSLVPTIAITGTSVSPASGVAHTFVDGVPSTYTVTAFDTTTQAYAVTVTVAGSLGLPTATSVAVSGTATLGQTLTGSYTFTDPNGHPEGTSTFRWLRSATAGGSYTAISGATSSTYVVASADQGMYLKFEVTPVATSPTASGTPALSAATAQVPAAPVVVVSSGGGGGGLSGGGGFPTGTVVNTGVGCTAGAAFSTATGLPCATASTTVPADCTNGAAFSTSTGIQCPSTGTARTPSTGGLMLTAHLIRGVTNSDVKLLQQFLNAHGYTVAVTGAGSAGHESSYFGPATKAAVIKFQKANGLDADGAVGPMTRAKINAF